MDKSGDTEATRRRSYYGGGPWPSPFLSFYPRRCSSVAMGGEMTTPPLSDRILATSAADDVVEHKKRTFPFVA